MCVPTRRTIARSYAFWLPLHFITYGAMPARHRLVWVSFCSIGFATLLSWSISEGEAATDAGGDAVVVGQPGHVAPQSSAQQRMDES